jgi:hypothetical protein
MDRRKRIFGSCVKAIKDTGVVKLSPVTLATNLLLFDDYIMHSCLFEEFPQMISVFGYKETLELLKSNNFKIKCDPSQIVIMGSTQELINAGKAFTYEFSIIRADNHQEYIHQSFESLHTNSKLPDKQIIKLKSALIGRLDRSVRNPDVTKIPEVLAASSLMNELAFNVPNIKKAVALELKNKHSIIVSPSEFSVKLHRTEGDTFEAENNLQDLFRLNKQESHELIKDALFRLAGINMSVAYMNHYTALSSYNDRDLPIFEDKLAFLENEHNPEAQINRLRRILEIKDFPDFESLAQDGNLRLDKILEIRETKEAKDFRDWLSNIDSVTDEEIRNQLESFKNRIGNYLPTKKGKTLRLLVSSGIGMAANFATGFPVIGLVSSAINTFIIEKIFPSSGPISFINNMLPSTFAINKKEIQNSSENSYQKIFDI